MSLADYGKNLERQRALEGRSMRMIRAAFLAMAGLWPATTVFAHSAHSPEPGNPPALTTLPQDKNRLIVPPPIATGPLPDQPRMNLPGEAPLTDDFWTSIDYLWWWTKPSDTSIPLISTGPRTGLTTVLGNGVIGQPGTSIAFPQKDITYGTFSGMRLNGGFWFDDAKTAGLETTFLLTENRTYGYNFDANEASSFFPTIPYTQPTGTATSLLNDQLNSGPGALIPFSTNIVFMSQHQMFGQDINYVANIGRTPSQTLDLIAGFRWLQVNESSMLAMTSSSDVDGSTAVVNGVDAIACNNNFFGGQFGGRIREKFGRWNLETNVKIGLGSTRQSVHISGYRSVNGPGDTSFTQPGFVFTQPSNIGLNVVNRFAVLPEVGAKVSYDLFDWCSVSLGYNFLYLSSVARANNQFDNETQPNTGYSPTTYTGTRPAFLKESTDYWMQGVSAGLELRY